MQQVPAPTQPAEEASSVPDPLAVQVTVEAFYELLKDIDVDQVFEEFIIPARPPGQP
jgi:hypothetical protein